RRRASSSGRPRDGVRGTDRLASNVALEGEDVFHLAVEGVRGRVEDPEVARFPGRSRASGEELTRGLFHDTRTAAIAACDLVDGLEDALLDRHRCLDSHTS